MRRRASVRALLISPENRLLLAKYRDERLDGTKEFWATAGGGIEDGESIAAAAAREILEETGIVPVELGPVVWYGEAAAAMQNEAILFQDHYIVARCRDETLKTDGWNELERKVIREMRWWTLDEIAASKEIIFPVGLATLLVDILAGNYPAEVLNIAVHES